MQKYSSLFIISLMLILLSACKQEPSRITEPSADEKQIVREIAAQAVAVMTDSLKKKLKTALKEGGPVQAINVCSQHALALTNAITEVDGHPVEVKRTTQKFRNPANMPDNFEQLALTHFYELMEVSHEFPEMYIQKIHENGKTFFYYYQPLKVDKVCLTCHGDVADMDVALKQILQERYPMDKATDYSEGNFRGLVRVKVTNSESM